jgi:hypothetical protein
MVSRLWFDSRHGLGIFIFATASKPALEPTQPPIQWVLGISSPEVKRPGRKSNLLLPSNIEVKNKRNYTSTQSYVFMALCLVLS